MMDTLIFITILLGFIGTLIGALILALAGFSYLIEWIIKKTIKKSKNKGDL